MNQGLLPSSENFSSRNVLKKSIWRKSADVFVQNFYRASFSCFCYRIKWNNLALDMEFSKATIDSRRNSPLFLSVVKSLDYNALDLGVAVSKTFEVQSLSFFSPEMVLACWTCLPTPFE